MHLLLWIFAVLFEECVRRGDAGLVGLEFHRCGFFDKGWHFRAACRGGAPLLQQRMQIAEITHVGLLLYLQVSAVLIY